MAKHPDSSGQCFVAGLAVGSFDREKAHEMPADGFGWCTAAESAAGSSGPGVAGTVLQEDTVHTAAALAGVSRCLAGSGRRLAARKVDMTAGKPAGSRRVPESWTPSDSSRKEAWWL